MISIIVATAENNVIGGDNKLLWHISEDLKRFKSITMGKTLVMGRKTFESLPGVLPGRKHIVITRDKEFNPQHEQVEVIHSIDEIITKYRDNSVEVLIIGGGEIYKQLLPYADKLYLTKVFKSFEGDTLFPEVNEMDWFVDFESEVITDEKSNIQYQFIDYTRK